MTTLRVEQVLRCFVRNFAARAHQPQCYEDARKLAISWLIMAGKHYGFTERIDQDDVEFVPTFLKEQYWEDDFNDDQWSMYQSEAR